MWRIGKTVSYSIMKTVISSKGQIVLPAAIRRQDDITAGQEFEVLRLDEGEYLLKRTQRRRNQGLVELLLACPVKGWFHPMNRTDIENDHLEQRSALSVSSRNPGWTRSWLMPGGRFSD